MILFQLPAKWAWRFLTVKILHLSLLREKDTLVPNSCNFIHSSGLIHRCFIWVVEQLFFRYRDSPAGNKHRKKYVLGTSSTARLLLGSVPQQLSCLSMMQSLSWLNPAKPKLAVHSTHWPDSSWLYIPIVWSSREQEVSSDPEQPAQS